MRIVLQHRWYSVTSIFFLLFLATPFFCPSMVVSLSFFMSPAIFICTIIAVMAQRSIFNLLIRLSRLFVKIAPLPLEFESVLWNMALVPTASCTNLLLVLFRSCLDVSSHPMNILLACSKLSHFGYCPSHLRVAVASPCPIRLILDVESVERARCCCP